MQHVRTTHIEFLATGGPPPVLVPLRVPSCGEPRFCAAQSWWQTVAKCALVVVSIVTVVGRIEVTRPQRRGPQTEGTSRCVRSAQLT